MVVVEGLSVVHENHVHVVYTGRVGAQHADVRLVHLLRLVDLVPGNTAQLLSTRPQVCNKTNPTKVSPFLHPFRNARIHTWHFILIFLQQEKLQPKECVRSPHQSLANKGRWSAAPSQATMQCRLSTVSVTFCWFTATRTSRSTSVWYGLKYSNRAWSYASSVP